MARNKQSVISQKISKGGVDTLNLPRSSVHDAYMLRFNITVTNSTGSSVTPTAKEILNAIDAVRLVTDSTRVHYDLTGHDIALLNVPLQKYGTNPFLFQTLQAISNSGTASYEFVLYLDQGDILACAHTNVELTILFKDSTAQSLTVSTASCTVTIKETIYSDAELKSVYGENLELAAEPKCYAQTATCASNTEFVGFHDLPTGTLLRGCTLLITNTSGTIPDTVGILRTTPDRIELNKEDFKTHLELDEILMGTPTVNNVVSGTSIECMYNIDFGTQWQSNGIGKDGWSFAKGDVQLAMKTSAAQTVRFISKESMVNTTAYANKGYTAY